MGEFGEVKDLIARYDTLNATNVELQTRSKNSTEQTELERSAFQANLDERNNAILNLNNDLAKLQMTFEESQTRAQKMQNEWDERLRSATEKKLLLGQIKMATGNLFGLIKSHLNNRVANTNDTIVQLEKIEQFIVDLGQIVNKPL